ncbi:hypothetical protein [Asaia bogorensis]|uniref:hypothetical protein n=1 Tax=Asaia bogorensis TaxID=91915 RepID=UPI000EFD696B|nr:hypothetical protein [Asaia bogorensis]
MIRYLSTGAADLARLLAQSHGSRGHGPQGAAPHGHMAQSSLVWAEAQMFFGFDSAERIEASASGSSTHWSERTEGLAI